VISQEHTTLQVRLKAQEGYASTLRGRRDLSTKTLVRNRLPALEPFLHLASARFRELGLTDASFAVQLHDEAPPEPCFRFDAPLRNPGQGLLIPDPYALGSQGFAQLRQQFTEQPLPRWPERLPQAVWRGSTTGNQALTVANLTENKRYQLCRQSKRLALGLDARLTAVVQCDDPESQAGVVDQLHQEELMAPRVSPWHLALHRWLVEIDGNVNSWGLLWKLLSGCCVVRVSSTRTQWYHHKLRPWVHIVPVSADLHDLGAVLEWCKDNAQTCCDIAQNGRELALQVVEEMEAHQQRAVDVYAENWLLNGSLEKFKRRRLNTPKLQ